MKFDITITMNGIRYMPNSYRLFDQFTQLIETHTRLTEQQLSEYAELIRSRIEYNLHHSLTWDEQPVQPLSLIWAKKKGHNKVFFYKGILYRSIVKQVKPTSAEIFVAPNEQRDQIASILHFGGLGLPDESGKRYVVPPRPFFGIRIERANAYLLDILNKRRTP